MASHPVHPAGDAEYYERLPVSASYRPRYLPAGPREWLRLILTEPTFRFPRPSILLAQLAHRCIMALPWPDEFRQAIDPSAAYERGYERALADTGKRSELERLRYYRRARIALLQLVRVTDDVGRMPTPDNMDDYDTCLEAARTALEESNVLRIAPPRGRGKR